MKKIIYSIILLVILPSCGDVPLQVAVKSVDLDAHSLTLKVGECDTLIATVLPMEALNRNVFWITDNKAVAEVSDGIVTAVSEGETIVTVKTEDGGFVASCSVLVLSDNMSNDGNVEYFFEWPANCHVVSKSGIYSFAAVKGNGDEQIEGVAWAEVLWESFSTDKEPEVGDLIQYVKYDDGLISFKTADEFHEGNAVVAVKDYNDVILWSWHLWFVEDEIKSQDYAAGAGLVMDRNLGAVSSVPGEVGAIGLLYQWGRKDPFLGSSAIGESKPAVSTLSWPSSVTSSSITGTIDYAIQHPTTFISANQNNDDWHYSGDSSSDDTRWMSTKTIYDPCPAGWRVPDGGYTGLWKTAGFADTTFDHVCEGVLFEYPFCKPSAWYPAGGYLHRSDGTLYYTGSCGYYWSVTSNNPQSGIVYYLYIYSKGVDPVDCQVRSYGFSVRCVKE